MLRWLIVCALLAQTLALSKNSRPSRHASWPKWMKMPRMEWPDWMPTQEDLPEVTIPEIQLPEMPKLPSVDIPDIQIPEINMQLPAAMSDMFGRSRWNPSRQDGETNDRQRAQASPGNRDQPKQRRGWHDIQIEQTSNLQQRQPSGYGNSRRPSKGRKDQSDQGTEHPSSNGQGRWGQPSRSNPQERPETQQRSNGQGRWGQPSRSNPQERPNGQWRWPANQGRQWSEIYQSNQDRQSQTNSRGQWQDRRRPDSVPEQSRQESRGWPSFGRGNQERPSQTNSRGPWQQGNERQSAWQRGQTPNKARKGSTQTREGPPQREEIVGRHLPGKYRRPPTIERISTRRRSEPSVTQQVEAFRSGMPRWLRDELNDTFTSMKQEIEEGRLRMNSWADDISEAAKKWWSRWTERGDSQSRPQTYGRPGGRPSGGDHPGRGNNRGHGRGHDNGRGRGHENGRGRGRGHEISNGRGHDNERGRDGGRTWYNKWYEGMNQGENRTSCRRPFRPPLTRPSREEPEYTVVCGGDDYEARWYESSIWVSVTVSALTYDLAVQEAYMKLYRYINGHNSNRTRITRTIPVHTQVQSNSRDRRWFERYDYTVAFYLPKDVQSYPPTPKDPALVLNHYGAGYYYAHNFRGYALEFNIWEYLDELTNTLDLSDEFYQTEYFKVNVYDAPWRFFNRRNDIVVAMDTELLSQPKCATPPTTEMPTEVITDVVTVTTVKDVTTGVHGTTSQTTTDMPTTATQPAVRPTIIGEIPIAIEFPEVEVKNPFENNELEEETGVDCKAGSECPRYATAVTYDGFEQRHYAYSRWICMDQAACDFETAQWLTQGALLEYFYPKGNREQRTMELTTPLVIGMDVADLHRSDCEVTYTSCMFIPEEHQSAPPTPRDARLYIQDVPAMSRYVSAFGGYVSSQNVPKISVDFLTKLEASQLPYDTSIVAVAQYSTSKLDKTRVNELWVMDQSLLQGELGLE
ncbi:uncharacterized protein [Amphiura filiformis]|uniref:uncharacterized protein n=1 Tax=Amphiura filiformis TaxID=82378 RepID=UPI003B20E3D4